MMLQLETGTSRPWQLTVTHEDTVSCCMNTTWYTISKRATTRQILHTTRGTAEAKSSSCTSIDYRKHVKILADVLYTFY
jgi:hypothetical protein